MALIECSECTHQVSEKASSCPKCGAPVAGSQVAQTPEENIVSNPCPFCKNNLDEYAVTCGYCGAEYGYYNGLSKSVNEKSHLTAALITTIVLAFLSFLFAGTTPGLSLAFGVLFLLFLFISLPACFFSKLSGKKWWKTRRT